MRSKTFTIVVHEFLSTVKRKSFLITTLSLPVIALLGMLIYEVVQDIQSEPEPPEQAKLGYVDATGLFGGYTEQPEALFILYGSEDTAKTDLLAEEIDEYFVIPQDYLSTGLVVRYTTERELEPPAKVWEEIRVFLLNNLLGGRLSPELIERAETPLLLTSLYLDEKGQVSEPPDEFLTIFVPYILGLIFILSIFFTSGYLLQSVSEEKENRIMEILLSSVSARELLLGKIVGLGAAGLVQIAVWFITIQVFSDVASVNISALEDLDIPLRVLLWGVIYFVLGYLLFATIYAGMGSLMPTARESQQWTGMFALPAVVPLMLMAVIAEHPSGALPGRSPSFHSPPLRRY
ncbi:MAG: ABC transporter permease [Chloroflexi bacterium]|nr:ABC transporter permease [Chloroflexota bacterium]